MTYSPIIFKGKVIKLHKARVTPNFNYKTILVRNHWDYVEMWLGKNTKAKQALTYWMQAKHFYYASQSLPNVSAPLPLYYSILNATKALLLHKGVAFKDEHGAHGKFTKGNTNLQNELITYHKSGVLSSLCSYFGEACNNESYSLKDLLYNLPFIHRSFNLTYPTGYPEIYIPIINPHFVIKEGSHEAWICAELSENYANGFVLNHLKEIGYERDAGVEKKFVIRKTKRFYWYKTGPDKRNNITELTKYHNSVRKDIHYIFGGNTLWYLKRKKVKHAIDRHPITIIFAAMHRLSELSRYEPVLLHRHFELKQNWLLSEFIKGVQLEFVDQIASEITNQNFMPPSIRIPS